MNRKTLLIAFLVFQVQLIAQNSKIMESFEEGIPDGLKNALQSVSIDTLRIKHGQQALKWEWKGNDALIFDTPIGYQKQHLITENFHDSHGGSKDNPVL